MRRVTLDGIDRVVTGHWQEAQASRIDRVRLRSRRGAEVARHIVGFGSEAVRPRCQSIVGCETPGTIGGHHRAAEQVDTGVDADQAVSLGSSADRGSPVEATHGADHRCGWRCGVDAHILAGGTGRDPCHVGRHHRKAEQAIARLGGQCGRPQTAEGVLHQAPARDGPAGGRAASGRPAVADGHRGASGHGAVGHQTAACAGDEVGTTGVTHQVGDVGRAIRDGPHIHGQNPGRLVACRIHCPDPQSGLAVAQACEICIGQCVGAGPTAEGNRTLVAITELDINGAFVGGQGQAHPTAAIGRTDDQRVRCQLTGRTKQDLGTEGGCRDIFAHILGDAVARTRAAGGHHFEGAARDGGNVGGVDPVEPLFALHPGGSRCAWCELDGHTGTTDHGAREQHTGKLALAVDHHITTVAADCQVGGAQGRRGADRLPPSARQAAFHPIDCDRGLQQMHAIGQAQVGAAPMAIAVSRHGLGQHAGFVDFHAGLCSGRATERARACVVGSDNGCLRQCRGNADGGGCRAQRRAAVLIEDPSHQAVITLAQCGQGDLPLPCLVGSHLGQLGAAFKDHYACKGGAADGPCNLRLSAVEGAAAADRYGTPGWGLRCTSARDAAVTAGI